MRNRSNYRDEGIVGLHHLGDEISADRSGLLRDGRIVEHGTRSGAGPGWESETTIT